MITSHDALLSDLKRARTLLTAAMVQLDADTTETTSEAQAWSALADAYQQIMTAEAFVDADRPKAPLADLVHRLGEQLADEHGPATVRHLRVVR